MNAILFAGDQKAVYLHGVNKAFLPLEGVPLFIHVLSALNQAPSIETVYIIGPRKQIMNELEKALPFFLFAKKIKVLEQKETLFENIMSAYAEASSGVGSATFQFGLNAPPVLFLPADIPLVTGNEIESFILTSDMDQYDYCMAVTSAEHLKQFYPKPGVGEHLARAKEPGIKMPYLYLKDETYRISNLHIARLSYSKALSMIQTIYTHRHQKNILNRIGMFFVLLKTDHAKRLLWFYLLAQGAALSSRFGLSLIATLFRKSLQLGRVEKEVSSLLGMRFKSIELNCGGAALDIDDEATYQTINLVFNQWHAKLLQEIPEESTKAHCPFQAQCHDHEQPHEHEHEMAS
ncbi:MAG: nucleotidyltransferase family protein [Nitrospirota bacterium]